MRHLFKHPPPTTYHLTPVTQYMCVYKKVHYILNLSLFFLHFPTLFFCRNKDLSQTYPQSSILSCGYLLVRKLYIHYFPYCYLLLVTESDFLLSLLLLCFILRISFVFFLKACRYRKILILLHSNKA